MFVTVVFAFCACASPDGVGVQQHVSPDAATGADAFEPSIDGGDATDAAPDAAPAAGTVEVTNDWTTFNNLLKPYGKYDEAGLAGFEFRMSSKDGFDGNDQTMNMGDETNGDTAIAADLGSNVELSGTPFVFSLVHVAGERNVFSLTNTLTSEVSVLCWGSDCPEGSTAAATLDGEGPITDFNGLQLQVRAQDVDGSSVTVSNLQLSGLDVEPSSDAFYEGTVTPSTPSSILFDPPGRQGQFILGPALSTEDWELTATVTLNRTDGATGDISKVRVVVDFVTDLRLPVP